MTAAAPPGEVPLPALLRAARGAHSQAMRERVAAGDLTRHLGVAKQAAATVRAAIEAVDAEQSDTISAEQTAGLRAGLWALAGMADRRAEAAD